MFFTKLAGEITVFCSITSRCSGNEPALTPRRDGWTRGFVIVDLHQSEGRLLKPSRHKLFFPEQIFKWRSRRCCLIWRAIVFWSVLSLKPERFTAKSVREAGKWRRCFCNSAYWIREVTYLPVFTDGDGY